MSTPREPHAAPEAPALRVAAVVPINHLDRVKTRLAPVLSLAERQSLVVWMAERVVGALQASGVVAAIAVVSPDPDVLSLAAPWGAHPITQSAGASRENHDSGLNAGLALGRAWAASGGADALLIALGDLPLLRTEDVVAAVEHLQSGSDGASALVLAPDRAGRGTNLLVARPAASTPLRFGAGSLARFRRAALLAGITPTLLATDGTRCDIDLPSDLTMLGTLGLWRSCATPAQRLG